MWKLVIKLIIVLCLGVVPYTVIHLQYLKNNDAFYWKSTYSAPSLILGGSRALKGIAPHIMEAELGLKGKSLLNFAFTGVHTPYGERYLNLLKRKIDNNRERSFFILSVMPMSIMDIENQSVNREDSFEFYDLLLVNSSPNLEYVIRNPRSRVSVMEKLFRDREQSKNTKPALQNVVHENGWVETRVMKKTNNKVGRSEENLIKFNMTRSEGRELWFEKTIDYLSKIGAVYLVRMPISEVMLSKEEELFSDFDGYMEQIAKDLDVHYYNFSNHYGYNFTDGHHHLTSVSAQAFSLALAKTITSQE